MPAGAAEDPPRVVAVKGGHIVDAAAVAGLPEAIRDSAFQIAELTLDYAMASLLAVRTPMEIEFAPSGSRVAFTLHAVVSEHGVTQPSDLWIVEGDADPVRLTDGPWADTHPLWSPDGSRLACISDRALAGHHLPYTMVPGEEPVLAASFPGSAEQLLWSQDGHRLLVLAADPGSYSREVSGTFVTGGAPELERGIRRSSGAWRRLLMVDLTTGDVTEVGPPGWSVWEVGWDGVGDTAVALIAANPTGTAWGRIGLDGERDEAWAGEEYIGGDVCKPQVAVSDDGALVMTTHEAHGVPPELARFDPGRGTWVRLTSFNHDIVDRDTPSRRPSSVTAGERTSRTSCRASTGASPRGTPTVIGSASPACPTAASCLDGRSPRPIGSRQPSRSRSSRTTSRFSSRLRSPAMPR